MSSRGSESSTTSTSFPALKPEAPAGTTTRPLAPTMDLMRPEPWSPVEVACQAGSVTPHPDPHHVDPLLESLEVFDQCGPVYRTGGLAIAH